MPRDFREDLKEGLHSVTMPFLGRKQDLAEALEERAEYEGRVRK